MELPNARLAEILVSAFYDDPKKPVVHALLKNRYLKVHLVEQASNADTLTYKATKILYYIYYKYHYH